jgi:hypothetical protein
MIVIYRISKADAIPHKPDKLTDFQEETSPDNLSAPANTAWVYGFSFTVSRTKTGFPIESTGY